MKTTVTEDCQLINAKELAKMLSLSKRQIHRLNACGKIPRPVRIGGSVRWDREEILRWITASCPNREDWDTQKGVER